MSLLEWEYKSIIDNAAKMQATITRQADEIALLKQAFGVLQTYTEPPLAKWNFDKMVEWVGSFDEQVEAARQICEVNDAAWKANCVLLKKLSDAIAAAGISQTYRRAKGRSYYKTESVDHDWYADLKSAIRPPSYTTAWLNETVAKVQKARADKQEKQEAARRQREQADRQQEADRKRTVVIVEVAKELGVDPVSTDADSLKDELRKRDKYLDLAVAMMDTRGDWSDGFYRVTDALGRFKSETETDIAVVSEVSELAHGEESDGRIFRDCTWNYSRLFELADAKLAALYSRLTE